MPIAEEVKVAEATEEINQSEQKGDRIHLRLLGSDAVVKHTDSRYLYIPTMIPGGNGEMITKLHVIDRVTLSLVAS